MPGVKDRNRSRGLSFFLTTPDFDDTRGVLTGLWGETGVGSISAVDEKTGRKFYLDDPDELHATRYFDCLFKFRKTTTTKVICSFHKLPH